MRTMKPFVLALAAAGLLMACGGNDGYGYPFVGGVQCHITLSKKDSLTLKDFKLTNPDGSKFDLKRKYKVVTNSYVASIADSPRQDQGRNINRKTADLVIAYLERQSAINYQGKRCLFVTYK